MYTNALPSSLTGILACDAVRGVQTAEVPGIAFIVDVFMSLPTSLGVLKRRCLKDV
jgi:hypothetical protein